MKLTETFSALGDPIRLTIVERLLERGELPVGALLDVAEVSAPAISRHLKVLHQAGLIDRRVNRQQRLYSARPEALRSIAEWTLIHKEFWAQSLDRLAHALQEEDE